jgi:Cytochrome c7 and related cytochrome c
LRSGLALLVGVVACGLAALLAAGPARAQASGFDHAAHARALMAKGKDGAKELGCARCHPSSAGQLGKRPDHATCFGECHGALPSKKELEAAPAAGDEQALIRARTCVACHRAEDLAARRFTVSAAPLARTGALASDFAEATLSHARHHPQADCLRCHTVPASPPSLATTTPLAAPRATAAAAAAQRPHRRCLGCHTGKGEPGAFAMDACERCHRPPSSGGATVAAKRSLLTVTAAFSHQRHQRYAADQPAAAAPPPTSAAACLSCHRALAEEESPAHPRPPAATCATAACHDGKRAFGLTEKCTQCHREEPAAFYPVPRPTKRFDHRKHQAPLAAAGTAVTECQGCHRIAAGTGAAAAVAGADHAACASCHAEDFGAAQPTTCGACHSSTEPWRHLRADRLPPDDTEFGARMDHGKHPQPCQRCHVLDTATRQLRPPRDHSACTGAGCHQLAGGALPRLSECAECHRQDLVADRTRQRARAPWSVRHRFDHARHRLAKDGSPAACTSCHTQLLGSLSSMAVPTKSACEPCHDGTTAFSVTGVSCNRCHGGVR